MWAAGPWPHDRGELQGRTRPRHPPAPVPPDGDRAHQPNPAAGVTRHPAFEAAGSPQDGNRVMTQRHEVQQLKKRGDPQARWHWTRRTWKGPSGRVAPTPALPCRAVTSSEAPWKGTHGAVRRGSGAGSVQRHSRRTPPSSSASASSSAHRPLPGAEPAALTGGRSAGSSRPPGRDALHSLPRSALVLLGARAPVSPPRAPAWLCVFLLPV